MDARQTQMCGGRCFIQKHEDRVGYMLFRWTTRKKILTFTRLKLKVLIALARC